MDCKFQIGDEVVYVGFDENILHDTSDGIFGRLPDPGAVLKITRIRLGREYIDCPESGLDDAYLMFDGMIGSYHYSMFRPVEKKRDIVEDMLSAPIGPEIEGEQFRRLRPDKTITQPRERVT